MGKSTLQRRFANVPVKQLMKTARDVESGFHDVLAGDWTNFSFVSTL